MDIHSVEGVPLLVADTSAVEKTIAEAKKAGRADWYEAPQMGQWQGPYRHHMLKRKKMVERIIKSYADETAQPLIGLDLGCGDGTNIEWLAPHFSALYGSDYNITRLVRASRVKGAKQVFMADVLDYPAADGAFDVVFFNHVLEHIPDDSAALSEVLRILKPGGLLVLGVPNEGAFFWQLAYKLQPDIRKTSDHIHFYTSKSIREKCEKAGFSVRKVNFIGWGVPHWALDSKIRGVKAVDDLLETVGRAFIPNQATSLYVECRKEKQGLGL